MNDGKPPGYSRAGYGTVVAVAAVAALIGFAAVYGTLGRPDNISLSAPESDAKTTAAPAAEPTP